MSMLYGLFSSFSHCYDIMNECKNSSSVFPVYEINFSLLGCYNSIIIFKRMKVAQEKPFLCDGEATAYLSPAGTSSLAATFCLFGTKDVSASSSGQAHQICLSLLSSWSNWLQPGYKFQTRPANESLVTVIIIETRRMGIPHPTGSRKMEIVRAAICHKKLSFFLHNLCQRLVNKEEKVGSGAASQVCRVWGLKLSCI